MLYTDIKPAYCDSPAWAEEKLVRDINVSSFLSNDRKEAIWNIAYQIKLSFWNDLVLYQLGQTVDSNMPT